MKICSSCEEPKSLDQFYVNLKYTGGLKCECKNCCKLRHQKWTERNKQYRIQYRKDYFQQNKSRLSTLRKIKRDSDLQFKLADYLRNRLYSAVRNQAKSGSAVGDLGCSIEKFKDYLQTQFTPGMTWDNWTKDGWHIDHKVPLSKFNLADPHELQIACHYSNLQPMWASDNMRKGNRI